MNRLKRVWHAVMSCKLGTIAKAVREHVYLIGAVLFTYYCLIVAGYKADGVGEAILLPASVTAFVVFVGYWAYQRGFTAACDKVNADSREHIKQARQRRATTHGYGWTDEQKDRLIVNVKSWERNR
jgi:hypothetical protein